MTSFYCYILIRLTLVCTSTCPSCIYSKHIMTIVFIIYYNKNIFIDIYSLVE